MFVKKNEPFAACVFMLCGLADLAAFYFELRCDFINFVVNMENRVF